MLQVVMTSTNVSSTRLARECYDTSGRHLTPRQVVITIGQLVPAVSVTGQVAPDGSNSQDLWMKIF